MAATTAPVIHRFSTQDLPERERLSRWREEFGRSLIHAEIEPLSSDDRPFHAEATLQALPGVRTGLCMGSATQYDRTPALVAKGDDTISLFINLEGTATASQRGGDVTLGPGEATQILTEEPAILTCSHHLGVLLPRTALAARVGNFEGAPMRLIPRASEPLRLLVGYLALVRQEAMVGTAELHQTIANHIQDLAALAINPNDDTRHAGLGAMAAARLAATIADISKSFTDPGLTLAALARRQGVSPRYLQRLLEDSGTSFTARVQELRLQRAFALLTRSQAQGRRIADIAEQAGFADTGNFNRLFRARFGDTPTGVRGRR
jgi:AraC-like DNA-binding protein